MGVDLRMVILTDYIIKSELPNNTDDIKPLKRIGVVPIFEQLRRDAIAGMRIGILSGSLVVIPVSSVESLKKILIQNDISSREYQITLFEHDKNFAVFEMDSNDKQKMVKIITQVFSAGEINVLVGTKSLLGEGWDAPTINSLILASFVGSYMLSNQMRGRAIRSQSDNPLKTANIWHLVCVEEGKKEPGDDFETLTRRFKAFLGVSYDEKIIENGINRLKVGNPPFTKSNIDAINIQMTERALDRNGLRNSWEEALKRGQDGVRIVEEVETKTVSLPRGFVFYNTIAALFWQGVFWGGFIFSRMLEGMERSRNLSPKQFLIYIGIAFVIAAVVALPKCLKTLWLFLWHVPVESSMKQMGEAVLRTMIYRGFIKTDVNKLKVKAEEGKYGTVSCALEGGSSFEKSIYLDAFQEILDSIDNPRYLITRKSWLGRFLRKDYYSVPQIIGAKKEHAEYFAKMWKKYVGDAELIYTRNEEGRKILLKARAEALSTAFQKRSERRSCWK